VFFIVSKSAGATFVTIAGEREDYIRRCKRGEMRIKLLPNKDITIVTRRLTHVCNTGVAHILQIMWPAPVARQNIAQISQIFVRFPDLAETIDRQMVRSFAAEDPSEICLERLPGRHKTGCQGQKSRWLVILTYFA
jgi:hypothetical protein